MTNPKHTDTSRSGDLVERLRGLLREAEVKLTDVQSAYATKRYADNLLARIRAALEGTSHE